MLIYVLQPPYYAPPFLLGVEEGGGWASYQIFEKGGGDWAGSQFWEGVAG